MNFIFYNCILEGRQLWLVEPFLLAASEAVRAVCKAGFQNNSEYVFEYAQPPKSGMFLFKVTRKTDGFSTLVYFDTRTCPNFIWVEKVFDNGMDITMNDFVKMHAAILLDYAKESKQEFDELLIEKNRYGAIWLHFAVRPSGNRHKVAFINA